MSRRSGDLSEGVATELAGLYRLPLRERHELLSRLLGLDMSELGDSSSRFALRPDQADAMVENAIGVLGVPLGLCVNLRVDERDLIVPMATEEPSVIAAASNAAKRLRAGGGIRSEVKPPIMDGQIQILDVPDRKMAETLIEQAKAELIARANDKHQRIVAAGGGARDIEVRHLEPTGPDDPLPPMLIVHLLVDVQDAMGANLVNSMCEDIAPEIERLTGGRVRLRIMSNLCDRRVVTVRGLVPFSELDGKDGASGADIARGIMEASVFAERDPHRATTHNKGIMNGVDAVLLAFGQDWRAVEAGAHAYAARTGRYRPLARWRLEGGHLEGQLEMPMAVGMVGGILPVHPTVGLVCKMAGIERASELASVAAAVGLAQNLGALRALAAEGIQSGHMKLHARKRTLVPKTQASDADGGRDSTFCREILPRVSRTFALSIEALPVDLREPVRIAYLLCRLVDTVEDEPGLTPEHRQLLFGEFDAELQDAEERPACFEADVGSLVADGANGELCRGAGAVLRRFRTLGSAKREVIRTRLLEMSRGMRIYSARGDTEGGRRIRDMEDLERYCYFVAGTVGKLLTDLFDKTVPLTPDDLTYVRSRAVSFGIGLQLVNILKDVSDDHSRGDCFLPESLAAQYGVPIERLQEDALREPALQMVRDVAARARFHLERAAEYTARWPAAEGEAIRLFCVVPLVLAFGTLELIEQGDDMLKVGCEPKVSREFVARVLLEGRAAVASDEGLRKLLSAYVRPASAR
jgi:hydroxymethylglutaryl-CoA reductase